MYIPCLSLIITLRSVSVKGKFGQTSKSHKILWLWLQFYSRLFVICNHTFGIIILLVQFNLKIWCKWSSVLDITGWTGWTLQLIVFQNTVPFLRPLNVPALAESTISFINLHCLAPAYFKLTGMSFSKIFRIICLVVWLLSL